MPKSTKIPQILLFFLIAKQCHTHNLNKLSAATTQQGTHTTNLTTEQIWGYGVLSAIIISVVGFIAGALIIVAKRCCHIYNFNILIKFLFSLSCGALIGDGIINVLGGAFRNPNTNVLVVAAIFISSVMLFLLLDRALHHYGVAHPKWSKENCQRVHADGQNQGDEHNPIESGKQNGLQNGMQNGVQHGAYPNVQNGMQSLQTIQRNPVQFQSSKNLAPQNQTPAQRIQSIIFQNFKLPKPTENQNPSGTDSPTQPAPKGIFSSLKGKGAAGYMSIIGSGIHNLFDGLALGVQFATANIIHIIPAAIAVLTHQVPRQLADVVIMLKTGFTEGQTLFFNGMVNILSILGVIIGLAIVNLDEVVRLYVMVFVAGNFLYVASEIWEKIIKNKGPRKVMFNILEFFGFCVGVGIMFILEIFDNY